MKTTRPTFPLHISPPAIRALFETHIYHLCAWVHVWCISGESKEATLAIMQPQVWGLIFWLLLRQKTYSWKLCTSGSLKTLLWESWVFHSFSLSFFFTFPFSNSSQIYLKLTLSSFIHQGGFSQRKEVGGWRKSKRGEPWTGRRERGGKKSGKVKSDRKALEIRVRKVWKKAQKIKEYRELSYKILNF